MGRPRKPTAVLELSGAFKHDPQRGEARKNEPLPNGDLGNAPANLQKDEQKVWREVRAVAYWLKDADRLILENLCRITAKIRRGEALSSDYGNSLRMLSSLGLTPADRSKIQAPPREVKKDALSAFFDTTTDEDSVVQ